MSADKTLLSISNIRLSYVWDIVLDKFSMQVNESDIIVLEGANGSGKTSLLKGIIGMMPIQAGTIEWREDIESTLNSVSWLGHSNPLQPWLTAMENLEFSPDGNRYAKEDIVRVLTEAGLDYATHLFLWQMSEGSQRRLAMCRLLLNTKAQMWLLDEPMRAVDQESEKFWYDQMQAFAAKGGAVVLSSHRDLPFEPTKIIDVQASTQVAQVKQVKQAKQAQ